MTECLIGERKCRVYYEVRIGRFVAETDDKTIGAVGLTTAQAIEFLGDKLKAIDRVLGKELGS